MRTTEAERVSLRRREDVGAGVVAVAGDGVKGEDREVGYGSTDEIDS